MNWKLSLPVGLALAMLAFGARASSDDDPVRFKSKDISMVVHDGNTSATFAVGWNPIDVPREMNCRSSAGCLLLLSLEADVSGVEQVAVCPFIDGVEVKTPQCPTVFNSTQILVFRAKARVSMGKHTVQTQAYSNNPDGNLGIWQFEYTLYELK